MKKRILIISNFYPPNIIGGYEIACHDTVKILKDTYDVSVLTADFKLKTGVYSDYVIPKLKCFKNFGYYSDVIASSEAETLNPIVLSEVLHSLKPDLVYVWNFNGLGFNFLEAPNELNIPIVYHFMDESILTYAANFKRIVLKILGRYPEPLKNINLKGNYGIFISRFLEGKLHFNTKKILQTKVIYPYVNLLDIDEKTQYSLGSNMAAIYIGQVEKHKGIDQLCEAIQLFNLNSKIQLTLKAFGRSSSGLDKELLNKYGDFLVIQSGCSRENILKNIRNYDLGFFPSIWDEPFGIAQIELMAAGLPVFTTKRGGSAEAADSESSLDLNFQELSSSLEDFISNGNKRELIGRAAREKVRVQFNALVYSEKIHGVIEAVLKNNGGKT